MKDTSRLLDTDAIRRLKPTVACPNCSTPLVAIERGPTHNVYECVECQRSFARRRVP